ncbi:uncharacterized protein LOC107474815 [Arachis duranensis]|uniref:Uncharacterized protein LOC107474815 n=1 Tax=Arachis duranensis TaxID=130453 RepID=A0A6P4CEZ6_ARADU|nr:uncharacterized protein LOC107474815 [Arachis duranensis]
MKTDIPQGQHVPNNFPAPSPQASKEPQFEKVKVPEYNPQLLYGKFMKELLAKKRNWKEDKIMVLTKECHATIQKHLPQKLRDPESSLIPCTIGEVTIERSLCDLEDNINLMPLSLMRKFQIDEVKPTRISLQLADRSIKFSIGIVENLLVKAMKHPRDLEDCMNIDLMDPLVRETLEEEVLNDSLEYFIEDGVVDFDDFPPPKKPYTFLIRRRGRPSLI